MHGEAVWNRADSWVGYLASQVSLGSLLTSVSPNVLVCKSETVMPASQIVRESETMCVGSLCSVGDRCSVNGSSDFHHWAECPETSIFGCASAVMGESLNSLDLFTHLENGRGGDRIA